MVLTRYGFLVEFRGPIRPEQRPDRVFSTREKQALQQYIDQERRVYESHLH